MEDRQKEEKEFLETYAQSYGYNGKIDEISQREFARLKDEVYLDHSGATQYPKCLVDKYFQDLSSNVYGNPHSRNSSSQLTTEAINEIRNKILRHFNTNSDEYSVVFTAGATASLRTVAECFDWQCTRSSERGLSVSPSYFCFLQNCHTSVVGMREVASSHGAKVLCIKDEDLFQLEHWQPNMTHEESIQNQSSSAVQEANDKVECDCPNLFVFPAMCNFSGTKYPLKWIELLQVGKMNPTCEQMGRARKKWFVMLDAASFVSTSYLNLHRYKPDFISLSFYKIFGFPTGLGALLVRNKSANVLKKKYYGGGTVLVTISSERFHALKPSIFDRFEDGTLAFLDIIALGHAFDCLYQMTGSMQAIGDHTFSLAQFVYNKMKAMTHGNGNKVCQLYCSTDFSTQDSQGPVINFNLLRSNGTMIGYGEVDKFACLFHVHLRTGSFCNTGASQQHLGLSNAELKRNYAAGHVCGDNVDLIDGIPTGSVRISFGYMSTFSDAQKFLNFIRDCFIEKEASCYKFTDSTKKTKLLKVNGVVSPAQQDVEKNTKIEGKTTHSKATNDGCFRSMKLLKISVYPIKSCSAFEVSKWEIGKRGLKYDRQWMVINNSRICLSQKREPRLCLIQPSIDLERKVLVLNAPGMSSLHINLDMDSDTNISKAKIGMEWLNGILDCGEEAANWLTCFLGKKCRLVQQNPEDSRKSKLTHQGCKVVSSPSLSLANVSQYLLISKASVSELYQNIRESSGKENITENIEDLTSRFRGNLVIDGLKCFEEDGWELIQIGQHVFQVQGLCTRCQMICLNQKTAERTVEPLKSLGEKGGNKFGTFGIGLQHLIAECDNCDLKQWLQVGDPVLVIKKNKD